MSIRRGLMMLALLAFSARGIEAQQSKADAPLPAGHRSSTAGVYTAAQAKQGEENYGMMCMGCHTAASHMGDVFVSNWQGRPVADFFGFIRGAMPKTDPGSLTAEEYAAIVAYILKINGMPAGREALPSDSVALAKIRFDSPKKGP